MADDGPPGAYPPRLNPRTLAELADSLGVALDYLVGIADDLGRCGCPSCARWREHLAVNP